MAARKTAATFMVRDANGAPTITPDGLGLIVKLARLARPKSFIASRLGVTKAEFEKLLGKRDDANPIRLAYEKGFSEHEADYRRLLQRHAERNAVPCMFYGKSVFGMVDTPKAEPLVENRINLTLPLPMKTEDYFKSLGIVAPLDFRSAHAKTEAAQRLLENKAHDAAHLPQSDVDIPPESDIPPEEPHVVSRTMVSYLKRDGKYDPRIHLCPEMDDAA